MKLKLLLIISFLIITSFSTARGDMPPIKSDPYTDIQSVHIVSEGAYFALVLNRIHSNADLKLFYSNELELKYSNIEYSRMSKNGIDTQLEVNKSAVFVFEAIGTSGGFFVIQTNYDNYEFYQIKFDIEIIPSDYKQQILDDFTDSYSKQIASYSSQINLYNNRLNNCSILYNNLSNRYSILSESLAKTTYCIMNNPADGLLLVSLSFALGAIFYHFFIKLKNRTDIKQRGIKE